MKQISLRVWGGDLISNKWKEIHFEENILVKINEQFNVQINTVFRLIHLIHIGTREIVAFKADITYGPKMNSLPQI